MSDRKKLYSYTIFKAGKIVGNVKASSEAYALDTAKRKHGAGCKVVKQ
jgi:hypothetical protein